jgi:hypothetical protein
MSVTSTEFFSPISMLFELTRDDNPLLYDDLRWTPGPIEFARANSAQPWLSRNGLIGCHFNFLALSGSIG